MFWNSSLKYICGQMDLYAEHNKQNNISSTTKNTTEEEEVIHYFDNTIEEW